VSPVDLGEEVAEPAEACRASALINPPRKATAAAIANRLGAPITSSARARIEAGTSMPVRRGILRDVLSTPKADSQPESRNVRFSNRPFGVKRKPALGPIGDYFDNFIA
jgi:hypothetical protein